MTAPSNCQGNLTSQSDRDATDDYGERAKNRHAGTVSLPRKNIGAISRLKSGVVATIGETITTRPVVRATNVSKLPSASKKPK